MAFQLPPLPYDFGALEPHIDAQTMEIHHDRHHQAYINNLNGAIEKHPELADHSIEQLLGHLQEVPEDIRTVVRNNGGGHANHSFFWEIMGPNGGGDPNGPVADAIKAAFGDWATLKEQLTKAAVGQFGSGWGWVVKDGSGKLQVFGRPNQDSPLMEGLTPVLGVDVWEHAYYLKYQNKRPDYVAAWFNTINWAAVNKKFGG
ncbi:MAG TPA: superoxide dismutase [Candidatus Dormibacteraeota bacterium]|nr:superoxide dismutase [Candidatus Dormibacteraeota bacterium]